MKRFSSLVGSSTGRISNTKASTPTFTSLSSTSTPNPQIIHTQIRHYAVPRHHVKARRFTMSKVVPQTRYRPITIHQRALLAEYKEAMWEAKGKRYKWRQQLSTRSQYLKDRGIMKFQAQTHLAPEERTRVSGGFIERVNKKKRAKRIRKGQLPPEHLYAQLQEAEKRAQPYKEQIEKARSEESEEKTRKRQEKIKEMEEEQRQKRKEKYEN